MPCRTDTPDVSLSKNRPAEPLPESLAWIERELESIRAAGLERPTRVRSGRQGATVGLDGHTFLNFGSNDYLGYAGDVRLSKAASKAACAQGFGAGASPLVSGHCEAHDVLEKTIAQWLDVEASLLFTSGFAANTATIAALAGPEDSIASDARNHASIIDGCRLSQARVDIYPHRDLSSLENILAAAAGARRKIIVTDTLFSMDGTIAPLADLSDIARRHGAILMVDEAHATGVFGTRGSGLVEQAGCASGVHLRVGTLSKALGASGGFVAGHASLIHWLRHTARAWIFSTAHPPAVAAAATQAIRLVNAEPDRRHQLLENAAEWRSRLTRTSVDIGSAEAQIVPIVTGTPASALAMAAHLASEGFFVPAIRPPSVPPGKSLVRASLSWLHTPPDLARLADAIRKYSH